MIFLESIGRVFCIRGGGGGGYVVTNEAVREAGEDMGEIYILLVQLEYNGVRDLSGIY